LIEIISRIAIITNLFILQFANSYINKTD